MESLKLSDTETYNVRPREFLNLGKMRGSRLSAFAKSFFCSSNNCHLTSGLKDNKKILCF
jgi:hypothetical protein